MARGKQVTPEMVKDVRSAHTRWPDMSYEELGRYAGTSGVTVGRILRGDYDHKAQSVPSDGGAVLKAVEEVKANTDKLEEMADRLFDMQSILAACVDVLHIVGLIAAKGLCPDDEAAQWAAILDAADPQFSAAARKAVGEVAPCGKTKSQTAR